MSAWLGRGLWVAVWIIAIGAGNLPGCDQGVREHLRFGLSSVPLNLDPRYAVDATSVRINRLLYQRLVDFDETMQPVAALADWQRLTPMLYRFRLRGRSITFTDGSPLDAADVKHTYDFVLDRANASPHRGSLKLIHKIELVDRQTLDFHISRPDPLFPAYLVIGILPKVAIERSHSFKDNPIGSGSFRFQAWPEENRLFLQRRKDALVVEFIRVPEPTVRVLKLLRGEIDLIQNDLPPELIQYLHGRGQVRVVHQAGTNFTYMGFNMADRDTGLPTIRQAIAHAIDRDAILRFIWGNGARSAEALFPPTHWVGDGDLRGYAYDPSRALALLKEAGYGEQRPLRLVYKTSSDPFRVRLATILQAQLSKVYIEVDVRSYDWGTFFGDIKAGRFQLYTLSWVGIKTPDIFRYVFHSESIPPVGANRGRYRSALIDRLIEHAESSDRVSEQVDYYRQIQRTLLRDLPYVPLWYENHFAAMREGISGYRLAVDGNYDGLSDIQRNIKNKQTSMVDYAY